MTCLAKLMVTTAVCTSANMAESFAVGEEIYGWTLSDAGTELEKIWRMLKTKYLTTKRSDQSEKCLSLLKATAM